MSPMVLVNAFLFSSVVLLAFSLSEVSILAEEQHVRGAMIFAPEQPGEVASDAGEDTLEDCLAKIPENASAGQRMLAERSCEGEEDNRRLTQEMPTF